MIRNVALAVVVLCLVVTSVSFGAGGPYVAGRVGYLIVPDQEAGLLDNIEYEASFFAAAAYGGTVSRSYGRLSFEGEASYRQSSIDRVEFLGEEFKGRGRVFALALMANLRGALETGTILRPYLLAGVGGAWVSIDDAKAGGTKVVDDDRLMPAYQLGGGLELDLGPAVSLDVGYSYFSTSKDDFEDELKEDFSFRYRTHGLYAGLTFWFQ